jgi:hypothetical protein
MLPSVYIIAFCVFLQASHSVGVPVKSKQLVKALSSHQQRRSSLYNLISSRPTQNKVEDLEKFHEAFAAHPDVKKIDLNGNKVDIAEQFQALRGDYVDRSWNRKMTTTVQEYLVTKKAKKEVVDTVSAFNYKQRRDAIYQRARSRRATPIREEKEDVSKDQEVRYKGIHSKGKDGMKKASNGKPAQFEELFRVALDNHVGDRKINAFDLAWEAQRFRYTHFNSELAFLAALKRYLQGMKLSSEEVGLALAWRRRLKQKEHIAQLRIQKHDVSKAHGVASTSDPSVDFTVQSATAKSRKSTVDQFEESPWWEHQGW